MGLDTFLKPYRGLPKPVYVIALGRVVNAMGMFVFPLMTLILTQKLGLPESQAGTWIALMGLAFVPGSLIGGRLADRFGRKWLIVLAELTVIGIYVVCGLLPPSETLIWLIMAALFMIGLVDPAHGALMADLTNPENRDGAYSLSYLSFNMGFAIGPALGGFLFKDHFPWIFWGDALTMFLSLMLLVVFVPETLHLTHERLDDTRKEEQRVEGSIWTVLLGRPVLLSFAAILFGFTFCYSQWDFMLPMHIMAVQPEEGARLFGMLASLNGIIVMLMTPVLTQWTAGLRHLDRTFAGGLFYLVGFGMLGYVQGIPWFFLSAVIFTLGEVLITISYMPFIANRTPASHRGRMNAVLPILIGAGRSMGPLTMGFVAEAQGIQTAWRWIGLVMLISAAAMALLARTDRRNDLSTSPSEQENDL